MMFLTGDRWPLPLPAWGIWGERPHLASAHPKFNTCYALLRNAPVTALVNKSELVLFAGLLP